MIFVRELGDYFISALKEAISTTTLSYLLQQHRLQVSDISLDSMLPTEARPP